MPKKITVIVHDDASTDTDFSGFVGKTCITEADKLRQFLAAHYGIQFEETNFIPKPELAVLLAQEQEQKRTITQEEQ